MFSTQFNDIYFSREDGLAESRHTYLAGNNLQLAWAGKDNFHILELGFGSGLNFLTTLQLWQGMAEPDQKLHYSAVEKYPLAWGEIEEGLVHWQSDIGAQLELLHNIYPAAPDGLHRLTITESVTLDLYCMDVDDALLQVQKSVDAFYLDGFAPAKNEAMWSRSVFKRIGQLSRPGSSFATFTVAAIARHGAQDAGFMVQKIPGYGRKLEMLIGRYIG